MSALAVRFRSLALPAADHPLAFARQGDQSFVIMRHRFPLPLRLFLCLVGLPLPGAEAEDRPAVPPGVEATLCGTLEAAAKRNDLPFAFFTRLIWQESRFDPAARSVAGAQGVAQFMPATAAERGLADPFEPARALDESAAYLKDLRGRFGNLGLAAAAYNAGPGRLGRWLAGTGGLPQETISYVAIVTGRDVEAWRATPAPDLRPEPDFSCLAFAGDAGRRRAPTGTAETATGDESGLPPPKAWAVILVASFNRVALTAEYAATRAKLARVFDAKPSGPIAASQPDGASKPASTGPVPAVPPAGVAISEAAAAAPVPIIRRRHLGGEPAKKYVVQIETDDRASANRVCRRLESVDSFCIVLRNSTR